MQLCIHVQLPRSLGGLEAGAIYISTESLFATQRLAQIASSLTTSLTTSPFNVPSEEIEAAIELLSTHGNRIFYYYCTDLEAQEHIVTYQLPVILSRYNIGLIIIDSVTANYRAEFERPPSLSQKSLSQPAHMAQRSKDLRKLAGTLKDLAVEWNAAVIAVNQVTDNFKRTLSQENSSQETELLALDYQGPWFEGGIDEVRGEGIKKPALGLVWANLITQRIMLVKDCDCKMRIKVVFSPFARPGSLVYGISTGAGVHVIEGKVINEPGHDYVEVTAPDSSTENFHSDFELRTDEIEFSDPSLEELLSGQTNIS